MSEVKQCTKCKEVKFLTDYHKAKARKDGHQIVCKSCNKKYRQETAEKISLKHKEHYKLNKQKILKYQKDNAAEIKEYRKKAKSKIRKRMKNYRKNNPHTINANTAKRRASKFNATPKWLTKQQLAEMRDMYKQAKELEAIFFNRKFHVDHIIPLNHPDVCGLHVPRNLQILTAEENLSKGNKITSVL